MIAKTPDTPDSQAILVMDATNSKATEKLLHEERYRAIINAIPDLMFRVSRDGEYLDFQGEGAVNIGSQIIGKNLQDVFPTDVAAKTLDAIAKTLDNKTLQTCKYELITPSGIRHYEVRLVVSGEDEVLAIARDITEDKKLQDNLHNITEKFAKAFCCSPNAITISTLQEGRFLEVNDSFVTLSGFTKAEVINRTALELGIWVNPSDRARLLEQLHLQGAVRNLEFEFRRKSGEIGIAMVSAEIIELDGVKCLLAVNEDITERKQSEAELRLSSQRDRLLTETLARIRTSLDLDKILQTTVTEVRQFLKADRVFIGLNDGNIGRILAESVEPNYPSILNCKLEDPTVIQEMRTLLFTHRVRLVEDIAQTDVSPKIKAHYQKFQTQATLAVPIISGEEFFGALIANQCSKPRHWLQTEIDLLKRISEQLAIAIQQAKLYQQLANLNSNLERQVEERTAQLQQKMQELQELHRVKDVVLHTISHELRTSVMGNLMVLKNLFNQEGGKEISNFNTHIPCTTIKRMIQGNEYQLAKIDSLLELHNSVSQGIVLHQESVNFHNLIWTIIKELEPILTQNQANILNLVPENLPLVMVDSVQIQRVFVNIITHSLQQHPPGMNLTVDATLSKDMIRTSIQVNGVGMSKLECDRLFDLHVRNPQAGFSTGTGLKLYLCRQIIKASGGEIGVISKRKGGLCFWFTIPVEK
jgi:PAS domain S-box-containing protein